MTFKLRPFAVVITVALGTSLMVASAPVALGAGSDCVIRNMTHAAAHSNLQAAVTAAAPGDALRLRGLCIGSAVIDRNLSIEGRRTAAAGQPTLDGAGVARVLHIQVGNTIAITGLIIRNGLASGAYPADSGGGIRNDGTLTLRDTKVRYNSGYNGGGISNAGKLTFKGSTTIDHNHADANNGGGVDIDSTDRPASMLMQNASSIHHNTASRGGGVNDWLGILRLTGRASIHHNKADFGGGVFQSAGSVLLAGRASVYRNQAASGGGVLVDSDDGAAVFRMNGSSSLHHNTATAFASALGGEGTFSMKRSSTIRDNDSSQSNGVATVEVSSYDGPTRFTMAQSSRIRNNRAGKGAAGFVKAPGCGPALDLSGVIPRLKQNKPRNFILRGVC